MATITTVAVIAIIYQNRSVFFSSGDTPTREDSVVCLQTSYGHQNRSIRADRRSDMVLGRTSPMRYPCLLMAWFLRKQET